MGGMEPSRFRKRIENIAQTKVGLVAFCWQLLVPLFRERLIAVEPAPGAIIFWMYDPRSGNQT